MNSSQPLFFAMGLILTIFILMVAHWFPWPAKLHRLAAYSIGVGAILAGCAVWLFGSGAGWLWWQFAAFAVAGGVITAVCWGIDALLNLIQRDRARRHDVTG